MKKTLIPILFLATLISCSKSEVFRPEAKSFTQWHHIYNDAGAYQGKQLVIHWHEVSGQDLATYEKLDKFFPYCDNNDILETVLAPVCGPECSIK